MRFVKFFILGLINFFIRFAVGGFLYMGVGMNPTGLPYGIILTLMAFVTAYILMRFAVKPVNLKFGLIVGGVWAVMALVFDIISAPVVLHIPVGYMLAEIQIWTRLIVIPISAVFINYPHGKKN